MNHIYKVIWNKAKHCYTVVSEIAKNHSTSSVSKKSASAVLLAVTVLLSGGASVYADNLAPKSSKIEIGLEATATGQNGVAIGSRTEASGLDSIAIGGNTKATGADSIAIGDDTTAKGMYSVAIGDDIHFTGESATAVGQQAHATGNVSTAIGTMTNVDADYNRTHDDWRIAGEQSTAIGAYAGSWGLASTAVGGFSKAEGRLATAVGYNSKANVDYGTALGDYSEVKAGWGVAIGASSVADRESGVVGAFAPEGADSLTWRANGGAVSVGSETITRQITNVAAGSEATDAVNVAQLKAATEDAGWNLSTGKEITNPTKVKSGAIVDFSGDDENITVSKEETDFATLVNVKLNRNLNVDSVNAGDYFMSAEKGIGFGDKAYITQSGLNANDKVITNVAAGVADTDAVNVSQLKNSAWKLAANGVLTEAEEVKAGDYVDFNGDQNVSVSKDAKDGVTTVKVELNKDLKDIESISNGDAKMALNGAAGTAGMINGKGASIYMQDGYTVINSKVAFDQNGKISGVAAGTADTDAVNVSQLKNSAWKLAANGVLTEAEEVKAGDYVDFNGDQNVSVSKDAKDGVTTVKVELNKDLKDIESISNGDAKMALNGAAGTAGMINGKGASIYMQDGYTVINSKVAFDQNGKISGVAAGVADTDAVNVSQLKAVGATANMGWNLATNGVATEATNVKPGDYVDFSGDKNISVSHDGTKVQVKLNENIDVNSVQTNALNSKYNLSVGTMAENGIMPFFVNSTGAFYAANNNFSVDKDGGVTATSGNIGNVTLNNGVFYKNSALRDGELYVGDNKGNHSQITSTNAKLGKVMIDDTGRISGVAAGRIAADSTDAINGSQLHAVQQEAGKHTKVVNGSNITVEETDQDGQKTYKVGLNKNLEGIESISNGDAKINLNDTGVVISKGKDKTFSITDTGMGMSVIGDDYVTRSIMVGKNGTVISGGLSVAGSKITNVAAGSEDTDAVNVGQLKEAVEAGNTDTHIKAGEYGVGTDNKVNMQLVDKNGKDAGTVTITDVAKASDVGDVNNIASDIKNQDGKTTVVDAVNNLNNKVGDLQYSKVEKGEIADGDSTTTAIGKLDQKLTDVAATAAKHTKVEGSSNITVTNTAKEGEAANYKVELKKDIEVNTVNANSVTTGQTVMNKDGLKVGEKVSVTENGLKVGDKVSVTENAVTAGQTSISDAGVKVGENTYISDKGLNANSNKITNVADGEENSDAVNYGQLKKSETTINNRIDGVENQVISNSNRINQLGDRVNKVGAGAAALAALHPLDFDPDDKWDFAAGYGNYNGENAAAIGAYYRPNEDTMFSVGGSFGNGENMVNAGVSLKLGQGNHVSTSKVAMAKEIKDLRKEMEGLKSALLDANAGKKLDTSKLQLFPDVPKNHWAYEYVSTLKGNGVLTGYPDGEFKGDRPMTRYEFATMLYKAMLEGATLSDRILKEFAPELERFTVDTVHQDKDGKPTVERVRTVKAEK